MLKINKTFDFYLSENSEISTEQVIGAMNTVNTKLRELSEKTEALALNIFLVIDFRMLSGMVGEMLVSELASINANIRKNPNIDGYPDLVNVSTSKYQNDFNKWNDSDLSKFIKYPYGGLEIKNTFGTKKNRVSLLNSEERITKITNKPDWKAHHGYTNNLLAIFSDFTCGIPQIVCALFSDQLNEDDWTVKKNPGINSTMTSYCVIKRSGWEKLKQKVLVCDTDGKYQKYFGIN